MKRNIYILTEALKARNSTPLRGAFLYVVENLQKPLDKMWQQRYYVENKM